MNSVREFNGKAISISVQDKIAFLELNRSPANAMDHETTREIHRAVDAVTADPQIRVAIFTSQIPKMFCGGADVSTVQDHNVESMDLLGLLFKNLFIAMRNSTKIFIAEINGHCLGGGLELALACDFRFAALNSGKVGLPEINLGLFPGGGAIQMIGRLVGPQTAFELASTGELISVEKAHQLGLFDKVTNAEALREETLKFGNKLANGPSISIANIKQAVYRGLSMSIEQAFDFERHMHKHLVATEDCREGVIAFREKRPAQFKGK